MWWRERSNAVSAGSCLHIWCSGFDSSCMMLGVESRWSACIHGCRTQCTSLAKRGPHAGPTSESSHAVWPNDVIICHARCMCTRGSGNSNPIPVWNLTVRSSFDLESVFVSCSRQHKRRQPWADQTLDSLALLACALRLKTITQPQRDCSHSRRPIPLYSSSLAILSLLIQHHRPCAAFHIARFQ